MAWCHETAVLHLVSVLCFTMTSPKRQRMTLKETLLTQHLGEQCLKKSLFIHDISLSLPTNLNLSHQTRHNVAFIILEKSQSITK